MVIATSDFWEKAYKSNYQPLCFLARHKLTHGNSVAAEETISEAFERAIRYARRPETIVNLPGYLWTIATHVWVSRQKKEKTALTNSLDDPDNESLVNQIPATEIEPDILTLLENERLRNEIQANRGPLTPREDLLLTRHLEGYGCDDIATELHEDVRLISSDLNAVRSKVRYRLTKARSKKQR